MKIVISNDDGYNSYGINILYNELLDIGDIIVIAPECNKSACSSSLTIDKPLRVVNAKKDFYYVNGTPADCIHLVVTKALNESPDIIISGINHGPNLGDDVLYSGTVAAAFEGRFLHIPSIAVSLDYPCKHFLTAAKVIKELTILLKKSYINRKIILNINVPDVPFDELNGFEITRLGSRKIANSPIIQNDPRGDSVYWVGLPGLADDDGLGTDFNAVKMKKISITPIDLGLTDFKNFQEISNIISKLFKDIL